jgi:hypothetical protein
VCNGIELYHSRRALWRTCLVSLVVAVATSLFDFDLASLLVPRQCQAAAPRLGVGQPSKACCRPPCGCVHRPDVWMLDAWPHSLVAPKCRAGPQRGAALAWRRRGPCISGGWLAGSAVAGAPAGYLGCLWPTPVLADGPPSGFLSPMHRLLLLQWSVGTLPRRGGDRWHAPGEQVLVLCGWTAAGLPPSAFLTWARAALAPSC